MSGERLQKRRVGMPKRALKTVFGCKFEPQPLLSLFFIFYSCALLGNSNTYVNNKEKGTIGSLSNFTFYLICIG